LVANTIQAIEDFTNRYYSTIPHVFGRNTPPKIDNDNILRQEVAMLDTLTDMEVANAIMKATDKSKDAASLNLLDKRFADLHLNEMTPLTKNSAEYKNLSKYLIDSSGATHNLRYRIEDIFRIERDGEHDRFNKSHWAKIKDKNRLLLWHGSRTTNFGGISQGLRIAPPNAPMSGYAFGKGVYLADCSSKSANYCRAGMSGGTGLLLLCEAELAQPMYEIPTGNTDAQNLAKKSNCFSTKGVGQTVPQKWKDAGCVHKSLKGVLMPDGVPGPNQNHKVSFGRTEEFEFRRGMLTFDQGGYLLYNEYIAYDVSQLRLRYLFRVGM
jgi:poly [ADP-ribose] polymerase 2/3/4